MKYRIASALLLAVLFLSFSMAGASDSASYADFLASLDKGDIQSPTRALQYLLDGAEAGEAIPDADITALLRFMEDMWPEQPEELPVITYPTSGLTITDWDFASMQPYLDNYLIPRTSEGMLDFSPDYTRIGTELYAFLSDAYIDYFDMRFKIEFFGLAQPLSDGALLLDQSKLALLLDIYEGFSEKQTALAEAQGIPEYIELQQQYAQ